jgi:hypothetical protein
LLEIVFSLAADDWPAVAQPCRQWIARAQGQGTLQAHMPSDALGSFLGRLLKELVPAVHSLAAEGTAHVLRLAIALQVSCALAQAVNCSPFPAAERACSILF